MHIIHIHTYIHIRTYVQTYIHIDSHRKINVCTRHKLILEFKYNVCFHLQRLFAIRKRRRNIMTVFA